MSDENRATLTIALWFLCAISLVALFISAAAQGELTPAHLVLAFTLLVLAVTGTPFILRLKGSETQQEKTKRHRVESVLRDMSDEELTELKRRLSDIDSNEEAIVTALGDDGEMVRRT
jgi:hypothetical protein